MPITEADEAPELATERLVLRPINRRDIPLVVELAGDAQVAQQTTSIPYPLTEAHVKEWLPTCMSALDLTFAIRRKSDEFFVGVVGLIHQSHQNAEIVYWIGRAFWRSGYATEAVRRVLRHGFGSLGLQYIKASVLSGNEASLRVLAKTGFDEVGTGSSPVPARGGVREVIVCQVTRAGFARAALSAAVGRT